MNDRVLDEFALKVTLAEREIIEKRLRVLVQPRPWWLPRSAWTWILGRLLVIEEKQT